MKSKFLLPYRAYWGFRLFMHPLKYPRSKLGDKGNLCAKAFFVQLERSSSFILTKWTKYALALSF